MISKKSKKTVKKFEKILKMDTDFKAVPKIDILDKLPPDIYEVNITQVGELYFTKINTNHDKLVDLPNTEYDVVVKEIEKFMLPETKVLFEKHGFLYKRSSLLEGPPGSGKTCIINRISEKVVNDGGIVLFSPDPRLLSEAFKILDSVQPDTRIMVIFEELDELIGRFESELLNLLDGEIQKNNIIFMATTNFINKIPARIRRPGRFSSVIHVDFPSAETRRYYLNLKVRDDDFNIEEWVEKTKGFSIDELKETVLSVLCLQYNLDFIVKRIKENKGKKEKTDKHEEEGLDLASLMMPKEDSYEPDEDESEEENDDF